MPDKKNIPARLTLRGKEENKGSFPAMKKLEKDMISAGYPASQLHVGYAVAKGIFYCGGCDKQVTDPLNDFYQGHEFWRCNECRKVNYIS